MGNLNGEDHLDLDLHHEDGTHRSTARSANGSDLERFEENIGEHLAQHDEEKQHVSGVVILENLWKRDGITVPKFEKHPARPHDSFNADGEQDYPYTVTFTRDKRVATIEYCASYSESQEIDHGPAGAVSRRIGPNLLAWQAFQSMLYAARQIVDTDSFEDYAKAWGATTPTDEFRKRYERDQTMFNKAVALLGYELLRDYLSMDID